MSAVSDQSKHPALTSSLSDVLPRPRGRGVSTPVLRITRKDMSAVLDALDERALAAGGELSVKSLREFKEHLRESENVLIAPLPSARADQERMGKLIDALMPDSIPQPVEVLQARRSAELRRDMLAEHGFYSADELADMHGSRARNRYALAARWARERRIFGVPWHGRTVFPAFQLDDDGNPYPVIGRVLAALPCDGMSQWAIGLWWHAHNAHLPEQARPSELVRGDRQELLVGAALRLAQPLPL